MWNDCWDQFKIQLVEHLFQTILNLLTYNYDFIMQLYNYFLMDITKMSLSARVYKMR